VHDALGSENGQPCALLLPCDSHMTCGDVQRASTGALVCDREALECPISLSVMHDPVILENGSTYERSAIEAWLSNNATDPLTNELLASKLMIPNIAVRYLIEQSQRTL